MDSPPTPNWNTTPTAWSSSADDGSGSSENVETSSFGNTSADGIVKQENKDTLFVPEKGFYQPRSDEAWEAYQGLLSIVEALASTSVSRPVLCGMADEVLGVLKGKIITTPIGKRAEIERILKPIPDFLFNQLVLIGKQITDYNRVDNTSDTDSQEAVFVPDKDFYQPKSEATAKAYKLLLDLMYSDICGYLDDFVMYATAHEILVTLKNVDIQNSDKRLMLEQTFQTVIRGETFNQLLWIVGQITDFNDGRSCEYADTGAEGDGNEYLNEVDPNDWFSQRVLEGFKDEAGDDQMNINSTSEFDDIMDEDEKSVFPTINQFYYSTSDHEDDCTNENEPVDPTTLADVNILMGSKHECGSNDDCVNPTTADDILPNAAKRHCCTNMDRPGMNPAMAGGAISTTATEHLCSSDDALAVNSTVAVGIVLSTVTKHPCGGDDEPDQDPVMADVILASPTKHFCSAEDGPGMNPTVTGGVSSLITDTKTLCSSDDEPEMISMGPDVNVPSHATRLEYSSEEELLYLDIVGEPEEVDEEDWVKIDYYEDGI